MAGSQEDPVAGDKKHRFLPPGALHPDGEEGRRCPVGFHILAGTFLRTLAGQSQPTPLSSLPAPEGLVDVEGSPGQPSRLVVS